MQNYIGSQNRWLGALNLLVGRFAHHRHDWAAETNLFWFSPYLRWSLNCRPYSPESYIPETGSTYVWNPGLEQLFGNVLSVKAQQRRNLAKVLSDELCKKKAPQA